MNKKIAHIAFATSGKGKEFSTSDYGKIFMLRNPVNGKIIPAVFADSRGTRYQGVEISLRAVHDLGITTQRYNYGTDTVGTHNIEVYLP